MGMVAGIAGGLAAAAILALGGFFVLRRKRRQRQQEAQSKKRLLTAVAAAAEHNGSDNGSKSSKSATPRSGNGAGVGGVLLGSAYKGPGGGGGQLMEVLVPGQRPIWGVPSGGCPPLASEREVLGSWVGRGVAWYEAEAVQGLPSWLLQTLSKQSLQPPTLRPAPCSSLPAADMGSLQSSPSKAGSLAPLLRTQPSSGMRNALLKFPSGISAASSHDNPMFEEAGGDGAGLWAFSQGSQGPTLQSVLPQHVGGWELQSQVVTQQALAQARVAAQQAALEQAAQQQQAVEEGWRPDILAMMERKAATGERGWGCCFEWAAPEAEAVGYRPGRAAVAGVWSLVCCCFCAAVLQLACTACTLQPPRCWSSRGNGRTGHSGGAAAPSCPPLVAAAAMMAAAATAATENLKRAAAVAPPARRTGRCGVASRGTGTCRRRHPSVTCCRW